METIRIGVYNLYPFLYVDESNNLAGIIAIPYYNFYYFIVAKVNATFVSDPENSIDFCADNGVCTGSALMQQNDEIDLSHRIDLSGLNNVGTNLTLTSMIAEENCYLSYNSKLQVGLMSSSFFDFFSSFQLTFWILTFCCFFVFLLVNSFSLKFNRSISLVKIFWSQFDYIFGQNYISHCAIQKKYFFLIFVIFQLLINKLLLASLRTGLVQHSEYLQLESFRDVLKYNFTVKVSFPTVCTREFLHSVDSVVRKAKVEHDVNPGTPTTNDLYQTLRRDRTVNCINIVNFQVAKNYGCSMYQTEEMREPLRKSEQPVFRVQLGFLINKLASAKKKKIITTGLYSAFETAVISLKTIVKLNERFFLKSDSYSSCTDYKYDTAEVKVVPISMTYLKVPFIIFFIGLIISVPIFIVQCNRFYIHHYFFNKSC